MKFRDINSLLLSQAWREEGQWIRRLSPVRVQSAGGNASGKPRYPCSDLEDALVLYARLSGQSVALNTNQSYKTAEQNNAVVTCCKSEAMSTITECVDDVV